MKRRSRPSARAVLAAVAVVALIAAMALDTRVVRVGAAGDAQSGGFAPERYGAATFPTIRASVTQKAVDAATLAAAIARNQDEAQKRYGVAADTGAEFPVKFTGTVGKRDEDAGTWEVAVAGVPDTVRIAIQTGPAITGTDLRDGTGQIAFGQFSNQIDYQNAGAALNKAMKSAVLSRVDVDHLAGKTVSVVGVFQLTDPAHWLVTPVALDVR